MINDSDRLGTERWSSARYTLTLQQISLITRDTDASTVWIADVFYFLLGLPVTRQDSHLNLNNIL